MNKCYVCKKCGMTHYKIITKCEKPEKCNNCGRKLIKKEEEVRFYEC